MALIASRRRAFSRKLFGVRVLVAAFASLGRFLERHVAQVDLKIRRLMALNAGDSFVRSDQWICRLIVVELGQVFPVGLVVANLATGSAPVRTFLDHEFLKLAAMRVLMAGRAGHVREMEGD